MPYCPACNQEPDGGEARCPQCRVFYAERHCSDCGREVFPKEMYCVECGQRLRSLAVSSANLRPANLPRRFAATVVDAVFIMLLAEVMQFVFGNEVLSLAGSALLYYGLFQARGRQTLGQYVLRLTVLTEDRLPLKLLQSCQRALLGALSWALVVPPLLALRDKERRTPLDRYLKVQVFRTP